MRKTRLATADYILANRIPRPAKLVIRSLPKPLGARLLSADIAKLAWTFTGSGQFRVERFHPHLTLSISENALAAGSGQNPRCHWRAGVFERLYQRLVRPHLRMTEGTCCAAGDKACRFQIAPHF